MAETDFDRGATKSSIPPCFLQAAPTTIRMGECWFLHQPGLNWLARFHSVGVIAQAGLGKPNQERQLGCMQKRKMELLVR